MATLKEMIDKHGFGVKFKVSNWPPDCWFAPAVIDEGEDVHGITDCFGCSSRDLASAGWELYKEPKKKVKMYKFAYREGGSYCDTHRFYRDREQLVSSGRYSTSQLSTAIRLDHTMIEVEED